MTLSAEDEVEDLLAELDAFAERLASFTASHGVGHMLVTWYRHRVGALRRALDARDARRRIAPDRPDAAYEFADVIGDSDVFRDLLAAVARIGPTDAVVLIEGERGTGKELLARKIHGLSPRASGPFVLIDCAALPADADERAARLKAAKGGTLFFKDVSDLSADSQAHVLSILAGALDARVVAATTRELAAEAEAGRFSRDLLHRLGIIRLRAPALRERTGDVPLLAAHFLAQFAEEHYRSLRRIRPDALAALEAFPWAGNVRELASTIERGVLLSGDQETELALDRLGIDGTPERTRF